MGCGSSTDKGEGALEPVSAIPPHTRTRTEASGFSSTTRGEVNLQRRSRARGGRRGNAPPISLDSPSQQPDTFRLPHTRQQQGGQKPPVLLPDDPNFRVGANGKNGYTVEDIYEPLGHELGKGTFGSVGKWRHKFGSNSAVSNGSTSWRTVAIKKTAPTILDRRHGPIKTYSDIESKCQEVKTLMQLRTDYPELSCVLYLYEYFYTLNESTGNLELSLVTNLLGKELDQWRQEQNVFMESSAKEIARVLLNALDFMHSRGVVHRDIKLQNVLFGVNGDFSTLKIVDFGLAKVLVGDRTAKDFCGSLGYIAPEIYKAQPYRFEVDMFAFGVIVFRLLSGARPFSSQNQEKLRRDTIDLRYSVQGNAWQNISSDGLKLVRNLLIGREQRLSAVQAIDHDWFLAQEDSLLRVDYSQTIDHQHENSSFSKALALSHAPTAPTTGDGSRFWLDASVERAVQVLMSEGRYVGRITEDSREENADLICVEEIKPPNASVLPLYIKNLPRYTEKDCRRICREIAECIQLSHENGMAHRNLHMNNFLVNRSGHLMVKGLQYAQAVEEDQPLTGHFGYLYSWYAFKAPEIDSDFFHDESVDLWSLGALIYMSLTALPPFRGDGADLITNKHAGHVVFDMVIPSVPAQKLINGLLQVDPRDRMTIEEVLHSEWMIETDDVLDRYDLSLAHSFFHDWGQRPGL